jgi:TolA-binding protein
LEGRTVRRLLVLGSALLICVAALVQAEEDSTKAAATRKLLKHKVTVEWKEQALRDALDELKEQVKGLSINPKGVQLNTKITLNVKDVPLEDVLKTMCDKNEWGYYIISKEKNAYDGQLVLKVGKERGYEEGKGPKEEPDAKGKTKDKGKDKAEAKDKKKPKDDAEPKDKAQPKEKAEPKDNPVDDEERAERAATLKLKTAKELIKEGKNDRAKQVLEDLLKKYPKTKAAEEAKELQKKLDE